MTSNITNYMLSKITNALITNAVVVVVIITYAYFYLQNIKYNVYQITSSSVATSCLEQQQKL
jgi:putative effector of murein hydrolase